MSVHGKTEGQVMSVGTGSTFMDPWATAVETWQKELSKYYYRAVRASTSTSISLFNAQSPAPTNLSQLKFKGHSTHFLERLGRYFSFNKVSHRIIWRSIVLSVTSIKILQDNIVFLKVLYIQVSTYSEVSDNRYVRTANKGPWEWNSTPRPRPILFFYLS